MRAFRYAVVVVAIAAVSPAPHAAPAAAPTIEQFLSPAYPLQMVSAKHADRIAWLAYERGRRNVYTAATPAFHAVQLSHFADDNGVDISDLEISDDGAVVTFVRGSQPNLAGWIADPTSDPIGAERTIWAARTTGGAPWKLGEGTTPAMSPDGRTVLFAKDGQIRKYDVTATSTSVARPSRGRVDQPFIHVWGTNAGMRWSPDGTKFAFVSNRVDHSFIGVYDLRAGTLRFLAPGVDHDTSPTWSPDSRRVAFLRKPGTPFAQQAQQGTGSLGNPDGPAYNPLDVHPPPRARRRTARGVRAWRARRPADRREADPRPHDVGVSGRLHGVVLGRRRGDRRGARVLARRAGRQGLRGRERDRVGGR